MLVINSIWKIREQTLFGGTPDVWGHVWYFVKIPRRYKPGHPIRVWCENNHPVPILLKDFKVEHWRRK